MIDYNLHGIYSDEQNRNRLCLWDLKSKQTNTCMLRDDYLLCYLQGSLRKDSRVRGKLSLRRWWLDRNMKRTKGTTCRSICISLRNEKRPLCSEVVSDRGEQSKTKPDLPAARRWGWIPAKFMRSQIKLFEIHVQCNSVEEPEPGNCDDPNIF